MPPVDASLLDSIIKIVGIVLGPALFAAVATFIGTVISARRQQARRERQIVRALFAEIFRLVDDLVDPRFADENRVSIRQEVVSDTSRKILISYGRKDDFLYRELKTEIALLPSPALTPVVGFYGSLAYMHSIIDDIQSETFGQISPGGRGETIDDLYESAAKLRAAGVKALRGLANVVPYAAEKYILLEQVSELQRRDAKLSLPQPASPRIGGPA